MHSPANNDGLLWLSVTNTRDSLATSIDKA
jgi:hypothetical protein